MGGCKRETRGKGIAGRRKKSKRQKYESCLGSTIIILG
jgi:hypothetical protein